MPASFTSRLALLVGASVALPSLFACLDHPLKDVEYDGTVIDDEQKSGVVFMEAAP